MWAVMPSRCHCLMPSQWSSEHITLGGEWGHLGHMAVVWYTLHVSKFTQVVHKESLERRVNVWKRKHRLRSATTMYMETSAVKAHATT